MKEKQERKKGKERRPVQEEKVTAAKKKVKLQREGKRKGTIKRERVCKK